MLEAVIGLIGASLASMFYLAYKVGKLEGTIKTIQERLNHIETMIKRLLGEG